MEDITIEDSKKALGIMTNKKFHQDFLTLLRARTQCFYVTTNEEKRMNVFLEHFCRVNGYECYIWDCYNGLIDLETKEAADGVDDAIKMPNVILEHIKEESTKILNNGSLKDGLNKNSKNGVIFVLYDFFRFFDPVHRSPDWDIERRIKAITSIDGMVTTIITGPRYSVPEVLENLIPVVDFPFPNKKEIGQTLWKAVSSVESKIPSIRKDTEELEEDLVNAVSGLTIIESQRAFCKSLVIHRGWDIPTILQEKKQIIARNGTLEFYEKQVDMSEVGGLKNLINWIQLRKNCFSEEAENYGIQKPRGILILGCPGTGKSLICKAIAKLWGMPLLRFDFGKMFHSHVGASEANIRNALSIAETVSPCVLGDTEIIVDNEKNTISSLFDKECLSEKNQVSVFYNEKNKKEELQRVVYIDKNAEMKIDGFNNKNLEKIKLKAITRTFKKEKLIKITTKSGKHITVTKDHLLMDEKGNMKKMKDFKEGDRISIVYNNNTQGDIHGEISRDSQS